MMTASWEMTGVVVEARELQSSKNPKSDWRGYVVKIATMGATFEVDAGTKDNFAVCKAGQAVTAAGRFEMRIGDKGGEMKLIATTIASAKAA